MGTDVSIIIAIFGDFDINRLYSAIESIQLQKGVVFDIIIVEQAFTSRLNDLTRFPMVTHILTQPDVIEGKAVFNVGKARNIGLRLIKSPYVYFSDADIVFLRKTYLADLLSEIRHNEILIRPSMWRLLKEEVSHFNDLRNAKGMKEALSMLRFKKHFHATLLNNSTELKLIEFNDRLFSTTAEILEKYKNDLSLRGWENLLWQRLVHCGAIFGRKEDIVAVGGYPVDYPICVYEDSDLQWKLSNKFTVRKLEGDQRFEVLHLDHDLAYRSKEQEIYNKRIFDNRKGKGVHLAIQKDISCLKSL